MRNGVQAGTNVWIEGTASNGNVTISVRDDGPGIDPELREKIFHPFVSNKEQGAGLGLAIVKRIVDANNARLEVHEGGKMPGRGAEFSVYFGDADSVDHP